MPAPEELRLFVAIELPEEARRALARVQNDLRGRIRDRLRWVRPEGIHLTLKFLGETPASKLGAIKAALAGAVAQPFRLRLQLDGVGNFGGRNNLRVLWIGLTGDIERLTELAAGVDRALALLGFSTERRPFRAHLTLARLPDGLGPQERAAIHDALQGYTPPELPSFEVSSVSLMKSTLSPGGSIYERLASFPSS